MQKQNLLLNIVRNYAYPVAAVGYGTFAKVREYVTRRVPLAEHVEAIPQRPLRDHELDQPKRNESNGHEQVEDQAVINDELDGTYGPMQDAEHVPGHHSAAGPLSSPLLLMHPVPQVADRTSQIAQTPNGDTAGTTLAQNQTFSNEQERMDSNQKNQSSLRVHLEEHQDTARFYEPATHKRDKRARLDEESPRNKANPPPNDELSSFDGGIANDCQGDAYDDADQPSNKDFRNCNHADDTTHAHPLATEFPATPNASSSSASSILQDPQSSQRLPDKAYQTPSVQQAEHLHLGGYANNVSRTPAKGRGSKKYKSDIVHDSEEESEVRLNLDQTAHRKRQLVVEESHQGGERDASQAAPPEPQILACKTHRQPAPRAAKANINFDEEKLSKKTDDYIIQFNNSGGGSNRTILTLRTLRDDDRRKFI